MLDFSFSPLPVVILALASFFLSWVWYSPALFAKPWMKALGTYGKGPMTEAEKRRMPLLFASGVVSSFLLVYVMNVVVRSLGISGFWAGAGAGAVLWAGFALTHSLNTLWEGRKPVVLLINNGLFLLSYAALGGVLAVWR